MTTIEKQKAAVRTASTRCSRENSFEKFDQYVAEVMGSHAANDQGNHLTTERVADTLEQALALIAELRNEISELHAGGPVRASRHGSPSYGPMRVEGRHV